MELTLFNVQISSLICHESRLCGSIYCGWEEMTSHSPLAILGKKAGDASIRHTFLPLGSSSSLLWHLSCDLFMGDPP